MIKWSWSGIIVKAGLVIIGKGLGENGKYEDLQCAFSCISSVGVGVGVGVTLVLYHFYPSFVNIWAGFFLPLV